LDLIDTGPGCSDRDGWIGAVLAVGLSNL